MFFLEEGSVVLGTWLTFSMGNTTLLVMGNSRVNFSLFFHSGTEFEFAFVDWSFQVFSLSC